MTFTAKQIKLITSYEIFAVLFVNLLVWVLREDNKREGRYQATINKIANLLHKDVENIKNNIKYIEDLVIRKGVRK
ncbi:MAG: BhlA/UviB family holin-like peptide [Vallitalea sp.]|jgi:hypothetical protein|nr:BhlA/UviB family holin-like peptide [Vallitalea sp.]